MLYVQFKISGWTFMAIRNKRDQATTISTHETVKYSKWLLCYCKPISAPFLLLFFVFCDSVCLLLLSSSKGTADSHTECTYIITWINTLKQIAFWTVYKMHFAFSPLLSLSLCSIYKNKKVYSNHQSTEQRIMD